MTIQKLERTLTTYSGSPYYKDISNVYDIVKNIISDKIFFRLGCAPEEGLSFNYSAGKYEKGVSCWDVETAEIAERSYASLFDRPLCLYSGYLLGTGSDYEPIITDCYKIATITRKDNTVDGWGCYLNPELIIKLEE